jgi:hypothetical protein
MPDFVLALCFFSMLLLPCAVALYNARIGHEVTASEPSEVGTESYGRNAATFSTLSRAELTAKRNRELYLRSAGALRAAPSSQEPTV